MNFLLFGGQPDSGKTSTVTRLTNLLLSTPFSFTIADGIFLPVGGTDFLILLHRIVKGQSHMFLIDANHLHQHNKKYKLKKNNL
ncbi:hypothetical protein [Kaistella sp.]|uniref:hypothetical protein n=1 Tax=Kaistella sp. TaxID=2782235 RepID=UPI003C43C29C